MENIEQVLEKDEKILVTYKPNKKRFVSCTILRNALASLVVLLFPALFILIIFLGNKDQQNVDSALVIPYIIGGLVVLGFVLSVVVRMVVFEKTIYCLTNRCIIIRRGFIKVSYQKFDYSLISELTVQVDYFDRHIKPNTGTISFVLKQGVSTHYFAHVSDPYTVYEMIKQCSRDCNNKIGN